MTVVLVVAGAAVGAPLRYLTDRMVQTRHDSVFPWGTFIVNIVGSFLFGVVYGAATAGFAPTWVQPLLGTGLCGALTTYSTLSYETLRLVEQGAKFLSLANLLASVVAGLGAAFLGVTISQAFGA